MNAMMSSLSIRRLHGSAIQVENCSPSLSQKSHRSGFPLESTINLRVWSPGILELSLRNFVAHDVYLCTAGVARRHGIIKVLARHWSRAAGRGQIPGEGFGQDRAR